MIMGGYGRMWLYPFFVCQMFLGKKNAYGRNSMIFRSLECEIFLSSRHDASLAAPAVEGNIYPYRKISDKLRYKSNTNLL